MTEPFASNRKAAAMADEAAETFRGYEVAWNRESCLIYDDIGAADELAEELGTWAKHATARHKGSYWKTFSLVGLP